MAIYVAVVHASPQLQVLKFRWSDDVVESSLISSTARVYMTLR